MNGLLTSRMAVDRPANNRTAVGGMDKWDCGGLPGDEWDGSGRSGDEWDGSGRSSDEWDGSGRTGDE